MSRSPRPSRPLRRVATVTAMAIFTLLSVGSATTGGAVATPTHPLGAAFDLRQRVSPALRPTAIQRAAASQLRARMQFNPRLGTAFVLMRDRGALTRPSGGRPLSIGREFLRTHASLFGVTPTEVAGLVGEGYLTRHNGASQLTFEQRDGSRRVFDSGLKVTVDRHGRVVIVSGTLFPDAHAQGTATIDAEGAVVAAARGVGISVAGPLQRVPGTPNVVHFKNTIAHGISRPYDITAELVTFAVPRSQARLAWEINMETGASADYKIVLDAKTAQLLYRDNGVADAAEGNVFTTQHPGITGAAQSIVSFAGYGISGRVPSGTNVNAYQDLTETNTVEYQTQTPDTPDPGFQHFDYNFTNDWALNGPHTLQPAGPTGYPDIDAVITQLFYYNNVMHDFLLGFGFNAAAGNFEGSDPVLAEATDGYDDGVVKHCSNGSPIRCVNNANFNTQPDGTSSRMQMFLFEGPQRDGAMDGDVIAHEYGHGLSGRLIANGNLGSTVQTGALGEGWSDITDASKWDDPVIGEYVTGNATTGIRNYSMASSPLKYSSLCTIGGGCEVHNDGEIWTAAFWDMRTALVARYPATGKTFAFQLIVDGMKNTAANPTFLSARDGILAADVTDNGGADTCLIWGAYAGREMGFSASTTGNGDTSPTVATDGPSTCTPVANIGGPYTGNEGTNVPLSAAGSTENGDGPFTYAWDFDNDGQFDDATGKTPSFNLVGQDGVYPIKVKVTNADGFSNTASTTVTIANVLPTVTTLTTNSPKAENSAVTANVVVTDPGWLDTPTATIDWGDGTGTTALVGTLVNGSPPSATLSATPSHTYGDNGTFTLTICPSDEAPGPCKTTSIVVTNVNPTAAIDKSGATVINGIPTFIAHVGQTLPFSGRSTDPGSDDLALSWDWGDGPPSPDVTTNSLNDPVNFPLGDPFPSPTINPRDVTDAKSHVFGDACLYSVGFSSRDDDLGLSPLDTVAVIIAGNATERRSAGYWQTQYKPRPTAFPEAQRLCYLAIAGFLSNVFNEVTDASTVAKAFDVLYVGGNGGSAKQQLDRQLLAAWLNFANGSFEYGGLVDTNGDLVPDTPFSTVMTTAEAVRLNPASTPDQLRAQKDLLERINS